jgi:hypothetical protein
VEKRAKKKKEKRKKKKKKIMSWGKKMQENKQTHATHNKHISHFFTIFRGFILVVLEFFCLEFLEVEKYCTTKSKHFSWRKSVVAFSRGKTENGQRRKI